MTEPEPTPSTCCFDEWAASNARRARRKETVAPVTTALLAALEAEGLEGRTILDVGCGTGDLALAALAHGAASANGIDLGNGSIDLARALSRDRGLDDRAVFEIADGSVAALPPTDVVVLNRVVCCYPDARRLLHNTLAAANSLYAFSAPVDRGLPGLLNKVVFRLSNVWYALRSSKFRGFRVFVHDLTAVDAVIRAASFTPTHLERRRIVWQIMVYARD